MGATFSNDRSVGKRRLKCSKKICARDTGRTCKNFQLLESYSQFAAQQRLVLYISEKGKGKGKAPPLQAMQAQRGLRELRLLDFLTSALYGRLSASHTGRLYPQGHPWYSFSWGAELTPGLWFSRKEICHWKIQWHDRESIPGPSD
jgi:hypothetical protein